MRSLLRYLGIAILAGSLILSGCAGGEGDEEDEDTEQVLPGGEEDEDEE
ncbi:MAG: hypothetical protein GFH27_549301n275 [Chloroflexi bacterium AL-W]|nr:hypothetical protein [Chloroflexi bacterium AL-N1]NOK68469.1 hypothetical protein [Chloroflexi bacterium AL-N10]NOK74115.1 hypothetical protein [Chloroflexi bacterium AL-N5]NOK83082.1 hypothetical protein [Chloroflexi bacterium AL-W]NOK90605.1 hypothetical protein [Chloroflexi bacterium AL-N15]